MLVVRAARCRKGYSLLHSCRTTRYAIGRRGVGVGLLLPVPIAYFLWLTCFQDPVPILFTVHMRHLPLLSCSVPLPRPTPLSSPLQEIRRIWVGYWSQADAQLGARIAAKLQVGAAGHVWFSIVCMYVVHD